MGKEENIAFRTSSETKQILETLAKEGYRSLSQQCEMIVLDWLKQKGYIELIEGEPIIHEAFKELIDSRERRVMHYKRDLPSKDDLKRKK
jgi:ribosomal protein S8